jgi:hypothetical protein
VPLQKESGCPTPLIAIGFAILAIPSILNQSKSTFILLLGRGKTFTAQSTETQQIHTMKIEHPAMVRVLAKDGAIIQREERADKQ